MNQKHYFLPRTATGITLLSQVFGLAFGLAFGWETEARGQQESRPLTVFLVRHAEKTDAADDPALTADGTARAEQLANVLRDAGIQHVHSSDYIRTRDTASPTAERLGLEVELYDAHDLPALVNHLRTVGGCHLVVGHSNTTPDVVEMLGGERGTEIDEKGEYDRMYVVTANSDDDVRSLLLRFGAPWK